jgi:GT2 family glycosyltransferase
MVAETSPGNTPSPARDRAQPHAFEVRGFGEAKPMHIELAMPGDIAAARAICEQEIALIDAAIRREKIPFPPRVPRERPIFAPEIRALAAPEPLPAEVTASAPTPAGPRPFWSRIPFLGPFLAQARWRADSDAAIDAITTGLDGGAGLASPPKISVVTVSFNQAAYLEAAIRSVLDQAYPNLEYIIVDGGSTDGSVEIIERYRDRCAAVVIEPDHGQSDALTKGFALAHGEILSWLCSDDLLEPRALWRVAAAYRRHRADLVVGGCVRIGESRALELQRHHCALPMGRTLRLDPLDLLHFMRSWQQGHYFYQPEVFFSRRIWEASGAYLKRHLHYGMDYELWLRMALAGASIRHIPPMIACSRVHGDQKTRDDHAWYHQFRQILEEYRDLFGEIAMAAPRASAE